MPEEIIFRDDVTVELVKASASDGYFFAESGPSNKVFA